VYSYDPDAVCLCDVYDGLNAFGRLIIQLSSIAIVGTSYTLVKGARCNEGIFIVGGCPTTHTTVEYEPIWTGEDKE
jgi:hypothetical protein